MVASNRVRFIRGVVIGIAVVGFGVLLLRALPFRGGTVIALTTDREAILLKCGEQFELERAGERSVLVDPLGLFTGRSDFVRVPPVFAGNGDQIAVAMMRSHAGYPSFRIEKNSIVVLDVHSSQLTVPTVHPGWVNDLTASRNGRWLASVGHDGVSDWGAGGEIRIVDLEWPEEVTIITIDDFEPLAVAFSRSAELIAVWGENTSLRVISWRNAEEVARFPGVSGRTDRWEMDLSFSEDERYLVAGAANTIRVWDCQTGQLVRKLDVTDGTPYQATLSVDNATLVYGLYQRLNDDEVKREVVTLSMDTGEEIERREIEAGFGLLGDGTTVVYSRFGRYLFWEL